MDTLNIPTQEPAPIGPEAIRHFLRLLPGTPGVYRMMNQGGDVLYVGKARDLKRRVSSYTRLQGQSERIAKMICETATMEFVTTNTEMEALLLEANLIKRLRPRYNVLMRDSKSFPHILLTSDHPAARLVKHRGARTTPGTYYGPFASPWAVNRTITALQKAFLLRSCTDSVYESRTRPCLLYQIKRCSGPCTGEIALEDYKKLVGEAHAFLSGRSRAVKEQLAAAMEQASEQLEFEDAAKYRDRLAALAMVQQHQGINPQTVDEADVFAVHQEGGKTCIQVFFFRTGQNWGNRAYFPQASWELGAGEVLNAFLGQFYDDQQVPRLVLLSHEVPEQAMWQKALATRSGHAVEICVPKRGEKRHLVEQAERNAREALGRKLAETSSQGRLLDEFAKTFGLADTPRRIEIYDNSHISGTNAVGAMVVAGAEGFIKNQYRKFNIRSTDITPGDDFGMMREVLLRRFSRLQREETARDADAPGEDVPAWPDVVLIDGGQGQLSAAEAILADLGLTDVIMIGVAKGRDRDAGRETFFMSGHAPFRLEPRDPVLYFLQRLRDEAHRFAIGAHRTKRAAGISKNPLDDIPGIGPHRKRALMRHFGSAKAVAGAGVADLHAVTGINQQMAQLIYDFFHEKRE